MRRSDPVPFDVTDGFGYRRDENSIGMIEEETALWDKCTDYEQRGEVLRQRDARRLKEHQEQEGQAWAGSQAGQLWKNLGAAFAAYRECLEQDPNLQDKALQFDAMNQKIFNKMKTTLERANSAPRCRFEKANGVPCRAPRIRGKKYCRMHLMLEDARPERISLPNLGDANGIQAAIAKGAQAVIDGKLEQKQASILGYYLQLAVSNIGRVDFEGEQEEIG